MKKPLIIFVLLLGFARQLSAQSEPFSKRTITGGTVTFSGPWEVVYGPHDSLWVTESKGYKISRVSLGATPAKTQLLDLSTKKVDWASGTGPQGGLMGLAIHPNLYSSDANVRAAAPWVYIAYVYKKAVPNTNCGSPGVTGGCVFSTRVVRYEYRNNTLTSPTTILDNLPGSSDHNSGRLTISPVVEPGSDPAHTQYRLYYSIGDMGAGQLTNTLRTNYAQTQNVIQGKILRLNTESDGDAGQDAWVPNDNPFYDGTSITDQDYVFSMGHRNPQGLVWGVVGGTPRLYSSEQSDKADDEINLIESGNNYGWDKVSGKCDGDVNGFKIGGNTIGNEVTNCAGTTEPIFTMFHSNSTWPTYPTNSTASEWATIAASSIAFYGSSKIPGWQNSLLVTPLKENKIYRFKLNATGTAITGDSISYFRGDGNRVRRIIVDPTSLKFYVMRDNNSIVEYSYTGAISTLPVKLVSFKASLQNNASVLQWETAGEMNSERFDIQRSLDGVNFGDIGSVKARGNSSAETYAYPDNNAANQPATLIYYRLKMVDEDGEITYSNVITISLISIGGRVIVSPNPLTTQATVTITATLEGKAEWKMLDNAGRIMLRGTENLRIGNNQLLIGTSNLAAGIYYFKLEGSNMRQQVKFQKL